MRNCSSRRRVASVFLPGGTNVVVRAFRLRSASRSDGPAAAVVEFDAESHVVPFGEIERILQFMHGSHRDAGHAGSIAEARRRPALRRRPAWREALCARPPQRRPRSVPRFW